MTNLPISKLRDGLITATIWRNQSDGGKSRYAVTFARSYFKDDQWHEVHSFSGSELLRISRLAHSAYGEIQTHKLDAVK